MNAARSLPVLPATRGDCLEADRPCPHRSCRHHLGVEMPGRSLDALAETCSLDVADREGQTLDEVAIALGVSKERVRQIEEKALRRVASTGINMAVFDRTTQRRKDLGQRIMPTVWNGNALETDAWRRKRR